MEATEGPLDSTSNTSSTTAEKIVGKKRKRSISSHDDDDQPAVKYLELSDFFTLYHFSDEVLFEIFRNLDTSTLLAIEKTCTRFYGLVQDHRLWNHVDLLNTKNTVTVLKKVLERTHNKTETIKINGYLGVDYHSDCKVQKECILKPIIPKCENLTDLELQGVWIDFLVTQIDNFPKKLKRLVFRSVSVRWPDNAPTVFQKMDKSLPFLEELGIESCTWFHPYDIMLFSKCAQLKRLSMRGCQNLSDFVPYGSMASRFGFKKLEMLDIRDTPLNDSDLQCFNAIHSLTELRLQCPSYLRIGTEKKQDEADELPNLPSTSNGSGAAGSQCSTQKSQREPHLITDAVLSINMVSSPTRTVILNGRVCELPEQEFRRLPIPAQPDNPQIGDFGSLMQHPHFWDMIDRQSGPNCGPPCVATTPQKCPVTNRGISCFGRPANPVDQNVVWIRIGYRPSNNRFTRLLLRHYKLITDDTLKHLVQCAPFLVYLDVTGTGVTKEGVDDFRSKKPECEVVCEGLE